MINKRHKGEREKKRKAQGKRKMEQFTCTYFNQILHIFLAQ